MMPTFLQETFRKQCKRTAKRRGTKYHSRKIKGKKSSALLSKESEALLRTTGTMVAAGAAIGTMGMIGKLGK